MQFSHAGVSLVRRVCSGQAILGEKNKLHKIDEAKCTKCGACVEICKFDAVSVN